MVTNFALQMCIEKVKNLGQHDMDLASLQCMIVGSEPLSPSVVKDFYAMLAPYGLREDVFAPAYGLAESTLMVTGRYGIKENQLIDKHPGPSRSFVSCGKISDDVQVVDYKTKQRCKSGAVGEIWISGPSVAKGYWRKPNINHNQFNQVLDGSVGAYFRTGDLGYMVGGELFITGRLKDVIIINGVNYYPEEIEALVDGVINEHYRGASVAFAYRQDTSATDSFVIAIKLKQKIDSNEQQALAIRLRKKILQEFQLVPCDVTFINYSLPKTSSGKIKRYECIRKYDEQNAIACSNP